MPSQLEMDAWVEDAFGVAPGKFALAGAPGAAKSANGAGAPAAPPTAAGGQAALPPADHDAEQLANTERDARNLVDALHLFDKNFPGTNGDIAAGHIKHLTVKIAIAAKLADIGKRVDAYMAISHEAKVTADNFRAALKNSASLDWDWESVDTRYKKLKSIEPALLQEYNTVTASYYVQVWPATSSTTLLACQAAYARSFATLSKHVDEAEAVATKPEKLKADVEARLATIRKTLLGLEDNKEKKSWTGIVDKLAEKVTAAEKEVGKKAQTALFDVGKSALKIMEKIEKAAFAQEIAKPGGADKLDKTVAAFGAETDDPDKQATCRAAIGARFNLDVDLPDGLSVKKLPQLYSILSSVPPEDVNHDKFKKLEYRGPSRSSTSYYNEKDAEIVLEQIPDAGGKSIYKRQDGSNAEEKAEYFNATTLHEIGHGVDAKFKIMKTHQGAAGFGQWKKSSLDAVVTAFYDNFFAKYAAHGKATAEDLKLMVRTLITTGKCDQPLPRKPLASLIADWAAISAEDAFTKHCQAIRTAADPWTNPVNVGGKVYIESYANDWWQYDSPNAPRASATINGAHRGSGLPKSMRSGT